MPLERSQANRQQKEKFLKWVDDPKFLYLWDFVKENPQIKSK